jgi:HSP20 family protein
LRDEPASNAGAKARLITINVGLIAVAYCFSADQFQSEEAFMPEPATKLPVRTQTTTPTAGPKTWHPFDTFRQELDRLIDDFDTGAWMSPFRRSVFSLPRWSREFHFAGNAPAVDIVEKESFFEITAELPGMDEKNIEVQLANGGLTIKGEKKEEKEEKKKDYYLKERHYGSFERAFRIPEGVDAGKIEATFKNGILTVTLPKSAEAKQAEKKIAIKAA